MINVPPSLEIESLPKQRKVVEEDFAGFLTDYQAQGQKITFKRQLDVAGVMFPANYYPHVKSFYEQVKSSDDETAVLRVSTVAQK